MELWDASEIKTHGKIVTKKQILGLVDIYLEQQKEIKERLDAVKSGKGFGYADPWDMEAYFPAKLVEVLDEETGLITFYEESIKKTHRDYVSNLVVVK